MLAVRLGKRRLGHAGTQQQGRQDRHKRRDGHRAQADDVIR
jgi:hypothetical protein